jgi:hypothetical protein
MYTVSASFTTALQSTGHAIVVRMDVLDTDFKIVHQFHDIGFGDDPTDILVDGNVDVDVTRLTRRTFTANVLNPDGIWSPGSDWGGLFYVNRMIRLWRGINFGSAEELVPVGTFMIDAADVIVERSMSMVTLSGSDLWKKFSKSAFSKAKSWPEDTSINEIIRWVADKSGVTKLNLDPLHDRAAADRKTTKKFAVEQGDNRGEFLAKLCSSQGIDIYFDPKGVLTTQDFRSPGDKEVVYYYGPERNNNLLTVKASFTDDNLYNAVLVVGTGDKDNVVTFKVRDTDPESVTNVDRIGERLFIHETESIKTATVAEKTAEALFYKKVLVNEDITLETICNPAFEGNDVIHVKETEFSGLNNSFRIKAFTVPLSSKQSIRLLREIKLN